MIRVSIRVTRAFCCTRNSLSSEFFVFVFVLLFAHAYAAEEKGIRGSRSAAGSQPCEALVARMQPNAEPGIVHARVTCGR